MVPTTSVLGLSIPDSTLLNGFRPFEIYHRQLRFRATYRDLGGLIMTRPTSTHRTDLHLSTSNPFRAVQLGFMIPSQLKSGVGE